MEFHPFSIIILISLAVVVTDATVPPDVYWQKLLPNTAMPKALQHLLPIESQEDVGYGRSKHVWWWHYPYPPPYHPRHAPFIYSYAASQDQHQDDPNVALFFLEKDLQPSKKMNLHVTKTTSEAKFLPRHVADTIPFSSNELSDILNRFSVEPGSAAALEMKKTVEECEVPAMEGEDKYCATSLERLLGTKKWYAMARTNHMLYSTAMPCIQQKLTPTVQKSRLPRYATQTHPTGIPGTWLFRFSRLSLGRFPFVISFPRTKSFGLPSRNPRPNNR